MNSFLLLDFSYRAITKTQKQGTFSIPQMFQVTDSPLKACYVRLLWLARSGKPLISWTILVLRATRGSLLRSPRVRCVRELDKTNTTHPPDHSGASLLLLGCMQIHVVTPWARESLWTASLISALPQLLQPMVIYLRCYASPCLTVFSFLQPQAAICTCISVCLQQEDMYWSIAVSITRCAVVRFRRWQGERNFSCALTKAIISRMLQSRLFSQEEKGTFNYCNVW